MSSFLLAGRTNSVQIAKVRAQRNLRAAPHTLPWLGGRETGKLQQLFNIITLFYYSFFPMCVSCAIAVFPFSSRLFTAGHGVRLRGQRCISLTEFMFYSHFSRCDFMLFLLSLVFVRLSGGVAVSLARS